MDCRNFVSMNIAIIGFTGIAKLYAEGFALAGHQVLMAGKNDEEVSLGAHLEAIGNINVYTIEDAAAIADLIIIATPPKDVREVSYWLGDVRRKVIIDASGNVFTGFEEQVKTVCAIKAITASPHVVKAFNTSGYEQYIKPLFAGAKVQLILVGDSKKAKAVTQILALDLDITHCYDFGTNHDIPMFNELTRSLRNLSIKAAAGKTEVEVISN
jgi:predicted dinucleotide-binding enzyme